MNAQSTNCAWLERFERVVACLGTVPSAFAVMAAVAMKIGPIITLILVAVAMILIYSQFCIFLIHPIGAIPEGITLLLFRGNEMNFIDSADAICDRKTGGVSILCRAMVLKGVSEGNAVILRLPYSQTLYELSTGGKVFEG